VDSYFADADFLTNVFLCPTPAYASFSYVEFAHESLLSDVRDMQLQGSMVRFLRTVKRAIMFNGNLFAARIRGLRVQKNLSQTELGAVLGMTKPAISDLERGRRTTTIEKLVELADYFNVSVDYLVGRSDDPARR
jgi:DNA-binding XRE family transcriptional regulator